MKFLLFCWSNKTKRVSSWCHCSFRFGLHQWIRRADSFFFASFWSKIFLAETFFALIVEFERMPSNQLTTPQKRVLERLSLSAPSRCLFVCLSAFNSRWSIDCNAYATFEREHNVLRLIISTVCTVCVCLMPKIQAQDFFKFKTVIVISKPSIYLSLSFSPECANCVYVN